MKLFNRVRFSSRLNARTAPHQRQRCIEKLESRTLLNALLPPEISDGRNFASTSLTIMADAPANIEATVGQGAARLVHFNDPNGVAGTARLSGPGTATLTFAGPGVTTSSSKAGVETVTGTPQSISIATNGTSTASSLNITGAVSFSEIMTDASVGSIMASRASVTGDVTVAGTVGTINLAAANSGTIAVSAAGRSMNLKVASASGEMVTSAGAIASITSRSWTSGGAIDAPTINHIAVTGELNAEMTATNIGQVTAGSITSSTWAVSGKLTGISTGSITGLNLSAGVIGPITDRGAGNNDAITTSGNIGAIRVLSMSGTRIEAGVSTADAYGLATAFAVDDKIASVIIGKGGFSNSVIGSETLSQVSFGTLSSNNNGVPFGVAVSNIVSFVGIVDGKRLSLAHVTSQIPVAVALAKAGIAPNDLVIRIV